MSYILDANTVIAADLDGTLAESKLPMTEEMSQTLNRWLSTNRFAVISGGTFTQFKKQIISVLPEGTKLENLFLFPTNGATCFIYKNKDWVKAYEDELSSEENTIISNAVKQALEKSEFTSPEVFGEQLEFRGGQVTFSALGQQAPIEKKTPWDPDQLKRKKIVYHLAPLLTDFTISIAGTTSIDITKKGIDKAYAIEKLEQLLKVDNKHIIFFGDALFEGGNDFPATREHITCIRVANSSETMEKIWEIGSEMK